MPPNTIYVGRPTAYGNPFFAGHNAKTVEEAIALYRQKVIPSFDQSQIEQLRGRNLCCWCAIDKPCHADILLEIANV